MNSESHYRIAKLKGPENYDSWKEEIQSVLTLQKLWLVTIGKETSPAESTPTAGSKEKLLAWEDKNARAIALIRLSCESGPRIHIKAMDQATAVWEELRNQYGVSDQATLDLAIQSICRSVQADYKSIGEYGENLKQNAAKCAEMGHVIPDWLQASMFRNGLSPTLEPYVFQLAQGARTAKRILTVDDMITALADHEKRQQYSELKHEGVTRANKASFKKKEPCKHCDRTGHKEEDCWTKYPEKKPEWYKEKAL